MNIKFDKFVKNMNIAAETTKAIQSSPVILLMNSKDEFVKIKKVENILNR